MSDEEDYMSSAFLDVKEDIRPGLISKSVKRKYDLEKKRTESNKIFKMKSRKELEEESRNIGLSSALGSDNKGFSLLQKMGYKPGMKLGRVNNPSDSGLMEPIKVKVKADRGGLGREEEVRKRIEKFEERKKTFKIYKEQETKLLTEEYRDRMKTERSLKRQMKDLHNCQKICEQLDLENGVEEPMRFWFWYSQEQKDDDDDFDDGEDDVEEEEELSLQEKLEFICEYVRHKYFYCFWCCVKYDNEDDLKNCPGPYKDCHDDLSS